ncbi:YwhD family protein [Paenibacillus ginsengarvi]|uniref:YwhD family protein n=1 Tax=Paenibacillus ginsengarvi TaxID=400777 RepID=A0A3B0CLJ0_9BACL|nr:YwhD family protein [Paenibacillus ginsengarvi]RKN85731.1 hypothetical protein D7M11_05140 [Paenibacillus ginsengarvi]
METNEKPKKLSLNVVSSKEHKGFGAGALDLSGLSSVIIDGDEAYIDLGAIHAKSKIERGVKFSVNKDDVPNGRKCWIVWVNVGRSEDGALYSGVAACEMLVDSEARRGWKILADHVNKMDYALKGRIVLDGLSETEKAALKQVLVQHNGEWWERSPEALKMGLA